MKAQVKKIKDLKIVLKDLERYVKAPDFLYKGRPFRNFGLLPREVLANWLICAVGNFEGAEQRLTFATDPMGGDGLIVNQKEGRCIFTEHVFIPKAASTTTKTVEDLMIAGIEHKNKKGHVYATGKHLIVFADAVGQWYPSRVARRIAGGHSFTSVWVLHLDKADAGRYIYSVSLLDLAIGPAPIWRIVIDAEFKNWEVQRIQ